MNGKKTVDVLLVEDNPQDAELFIRALRKSNLADNIFVAEDGVEALDFIQGRGKYAERDISYKPRVVFLDLKLPRVDGLEVLRGIKQDDRTRSIPVVVLTSSREERDIKTAYELGANSFVAKPVDFELFSDMINKLGFYWLTVNEPPK
jgi:CheY-like chemotaxis protein